MSFGIQPGDECPICLNEFEIGETLKLTSCGHGFHPACIDEWLKSHSTCPSHQNPPQKLVNMRIEPLTHVEVPLGEKCSICKKDFNDEDIVTKTACNHLFHHPCLNTHYQKSLRCPKDQKGIEPLTQRTVKIIQPIQAPAKKKKEPPPTTMQQVEKAFSAISLAAERELRGEGVLAKLPKSVMDWMNQ